VKLVFCMSGKTERGPVSELADDYLKRISRYGPIEVIEAKKLKYQGREGIHILLSPDGDVMTSEEFARFIGQSQLGSVKHLFFYTGGPSGFDDSFTDRIRKKISLSSMTFNHQLIRVMLFEQIYRAFTILNNEPYHK
jgi:23S rRNA (pseudouridine1915-N3)-methyltransferase